MDYQVTWEPPSGFYAHFTGWVTPGSAARLARELTADPRYDNLRYAIVDLVDARGHTFRRDDSHAVGQAMAEMIGARFTNPCVIEIAIATDIRMLNFLATYARIAVQPFHIFASLKECRDWLSQEAVALRHLRPDPSG